MNKYLMLTAAAVLAGTASANARTYSFTFGTANGGVYCDGGTVYTGRDRGIYSGAVWSWQHTNNNCAGGVSNGQGILGKTAGLGKIADMSAVAAAPAKQRALRKRRRNEHRSFL